MKSVGMGFGLWKKLHGLKSGEKRDCGNTGIPLLAKNLFTENAV